MSFLAVEGVAKRFGDVPALVGLDLAVPFGSRLAVVGPSGSGKTTLLRLLAGFETPDAGRIVLDGAVVSDRGALVPSHLREVGLVPQDGALFPHLTVEENIGFGLPRRAPDRRARILELVATVELDRAMLARRPHELSGGQQQRVALARALARRPKLMLLDEPFSALDTGLREAMRKVVGNVLGAAGVTSILVTHDQTEALSFADQVALLRDGRLVQAGPPSEVYHRPVDRAAALFMGEAVILRGRLAAGRVRSPLGLVSVQAPGPAEGPVEIMIRPEQIALAPASPGQEGDEGGCVGRVVATSFGGSHGTATVAIPSEDPSALPPVRTLDLKVSSLALPKPGDLVRLTVAGAVHAWPAEPARPGRPVPPQPASGGRLS